MNKLCPDKAMFTRRAQWGSEMSDFSKNFLQYFGQLGLSWSWDLGPNVNAKLTLELPQKIFQRVLRIAQDLVCRLLIGQWTKIPSFKPPPLPTWTQKGSIDLDLGGQEFVCNWKPCDVWTYFSFQPTLTYLSWLWHKNDFAYISTTHPSTTTTLLKVSNIPAVIQLVSTKIIG